jgi:hypothetical protein
MNNRTQDVEETVLPVRNQTTMRSAELEDILAVLWDVRCEDVVEQVRAVSFSLVVWTQRHVQVSE